MKRHFSWLWLLGLFCFLSGIQPVNAETIWSEAVDLPRKPIQDTDYRDVLAGPPDGKHWPLESSELTIFDMGSELDVWEILVESISPGEKTVEIWTAGEHFSSYFLGREYGGNGGIITDYGGQDKKGATKSKNYLDVGVVDFSQNQGAFVEPDFSLNYRRVSQFSMEGPTGSLSEDGAVMNIGTGRYNNSIPGATVSEWPNGWEYFSLAGALSVGTGLSELPWEGRLRYVAFVNEEDFSLDAAGVRVGHEPVPEPGTLLTLGLGIAILLGVGRRNRG